MLHPSYTDLMKVVNQDVEEGDTKIVNSRYSIVLATAKRARQLIAGSEPLVDGAAGKKPLAIAIDELYKGKVKIVATSEEEETQEAAPAVSEETAETAEAVTEETNEENNQ